MEALRGSLAYSKYFDFKLNAVVNREFSPVIFHVAGCTKDFRKIVETAKSLGVDTSSMEGSLSLWEKATQESPEADFTSIYNIINPPK